MSRLDELIPVFKGLSLCVLLLCACAPAGALLRRSAAGEGLLSRGFPRPRFVALVVYSAFG